MDPRAVLGPASPLAQRFRSYEERPGQLAMAAAVAAALAEERPLFVEAGTGTGKTLAYLVPAILSGKKVVVSTATKALQEQIWRNDIPLLREALAEHGVAFRAALMKGLANYVCKRRLFEARVSSPGLGLDLAFSRILDWTEETEGGDKAELETVAEDDPAWRDVTSASDTRIGAECPFFSECFVTRMKKEAEEADLVVVNHHLFFADLALRAARGDYASAIPKYEAVVFDEAHRIEDVATDFFGVRVSSSRIDALVRDASRSFAATGSKGVDARARSVLDQTGVAGQAFFRAFAPDRAPGRRPLGQGDFGPREAGAHARLEAALLALAGHAETRIADGEAIALVGRRAQDLVLDLRSIVDSALKMPEPGTHEARRVAWIDTSARSVSLGASPVELGELLRGALFERVPSVVCTSATLATSGGGEVASFHFARGRLGAPPETRELVVPSPFDFEGRSLLYLPKDLPEPSDPAFDERAAGRALELALITDGGAFILCTSMRAMKRAHEILSRELRGRVLVQGAAPKGALLDRFKREGDLVLVATMSFWEGVDVPGRALRLVVLDKIPFAVPSDPVVAARSLVVEQAGGNAFAEYSVPAAALTLKQGFGRLIRTKDDAGIVAVLDRRIVTRSYGKRLLASLPPARRTSILDQVREFWQLVDTAPARATA